MSTVEQRTSWEMYWVPEESKATIVQNIVGGVCGPWDDVRNVRSKEDALTYANRMEFKQWGAWTLTGAGWRVRLMNVRMR